MVSVKWNDIYSQARIESGIAPVTTKDDFYTIMSVGIQKYVEADSKLKEAMLLFLKPYAFKAEKSADAYRWMAIYPAMFIQWLAQRKTKKVTLADLEYPNLTPEIGDLFTQDNSESENVKAHIRSAMIKFLKFLTERHLVIKYPFPGFKVDMPKSVRVVVYNLKNLDEFYDKILLDKEEYYTLFFRLLLQTGARPGQINNIRCEDIGKNPTEDALGRKFYPIFTLKLLTREKKIIKEVVYKKMPAEVVYISESLRNDLIAWCAKKSLKPENYIFLSSVGLGAIQEGIRRTAKRLESKLSNKPGYYILYGLRHTWASVVYHVTGFNIRYLQTAGGWEGVGIPLGTYTALMNDCEAVNIVKKWEIYVPVDSRDMIQDIQRRCEGKEGEIVTGSITSSTEEMDLMRADISRLEKQIALLIQNKL